MKFHFYNFPFAPRRFPFFYGWVVALTGTLGIIASVPGQTHGVSAFTDHLVQALGINRSRLSIAYMAGTIASAVLLTNGGKLYDRFGARVVAPAACVAMGASLLLLSQCDRIAGYITRTLGLTGSWVVPFIVVTILFFGLRFSGQGMMTMVSRNMIMKWFDVYRGMVVGITGLLVMPAFNAAPKLLNMLVAQMGWRGAWICLAAVIGLGFSLLAAILFRDNPEVCGLVPDGQAHNHRDKANDGGKNNLRQYTLAEARKTYSFWVFALGLGLFGFLGTGLSFHVSSIFVTSGLTRETGFSIFIPSVLISMCLRPLAGWLSDRIELKWLLCSMLAGIGISGLGLSMLSPGLSKWVIVAGNGLSGAIFGLLVGITWPVFFGREHIGAISGFNMAIMVFTSAIGPWVFSKSNSMLGSYDAAAALCLLSAVVLLIAAMWADNPQESAGRA
ncbi:MAG: MFS transporter [Verrucomicrobiota bacterium]